MITRIAIFFLICSLSVNAQENDGFSLKRKIPLETQSFKIDLFGNIYFTKGNTLVKYNPETDEKIEYTNTFLGEISSYDISNPLKILLFYQDYNQLVFLDNQLSEIRSPVRIDDLGISYSTGICTSHQGGFWIINTRKAKLQRYDENLIKQQETRFHDFLTSEKDIWMVEKHKMLYCYLSGQLYSFDVFGNLNRRYPLKNVNNIQITNKNIYYFYEHSLYRYNLENNKEERLNLPSRGEWSFVQILEKKKYYLLKEQTLYIFHKKSHS